MNRSTFLRRTLGALAGLVAAPVAVAEVLADDGAADDRFRYAAPREWRRFKFDSWTDAFPPIYADGVHDDAPGIQARLDAGHDLHLNGSRHLIGSTIDLSDNGRLRAIGCTFIPAPHFDGPTIRFDRAARGNELAYNLFRASA